MELLNALHIMLISIPKIIIISINSSANERFEKLDIAFLIMSSIFTVWSIVYYFLCKVMEIEYDDYISLSTYK